MQSAIENALSRLSNQRLENYFRQLQRGLEKESLRVNAAGKLAQTPHPKALGAALTHSSITTDYAEALLEFVTPIHTDIDTLLKELNDVHLFTYQNIGDEKLWVNSMPCVVEGEEKIPIARYGSSNVAKMKEAYRRGLGHRYGRLMQTIAGIHFNFSLQDDFWNHYLKFDNATERRDLKSACYFGLTRNFLRHSWLACYLFGASPAVCKTFLQNRKHALLAHDPHSFYAPYATSLRLSDLGYNSNAQSAIAVCYNTVAAYTDTLRQAIQTPHAPYLKIPMVVDGKYQQLNPNILQIENEFYAVIRPKQVARSGESPANALLQRGVEYVEVRSLDLNPYCAVGINAECIRFFDTLLIYCLLSDSPQIENHESLDAAENRQRVVMAGRDPALKIAINNTAVGFNNAAHNLLEQLSLVADFMDAANGGTLYQQSLQAQQDKVDNPQLTHSARILSDMGAKFDSFYAFAMHQAEQHQSYFRQQVMSADLLQHYQTAAAQSLNRQHQIEQSDNHTFAQFMAEYVKRQNTTA